MIVETDDKDLALVLSGDAKAARIFGAQRLRQLERRVKNMLAVSTLEELRGAAGHFHELVGDRKGQWACDLDQPYRLIFEPREKPIPTDPDGRYVWIEIKAVELLEVTNYHGK